MIRTLSQVVGLGGRGKARGRVGEANTSEVEGSLTGF